MRDSPLDELRDDLFRVAKQCERFCYMTPDITFQRDAVDKLASFRSTLPGRKRQAVDCGDENLANAVLCAELAVTALANELTMWICLKEGKPNEAWDELVEAQGNAERAVQAHCMASHLEVRYIERLT